MAYIHSWNILEQGSGNFFTFYPPKKCIYTDITHLIWKERNHTLFEFKILLNLFKITLKASTDLKTSVFWEIMLLHIGYESINIGALLILISPRILIFTPFGVIYPCSLTTVLKDVVVLWVKPLKPLCCKVRRPAVVRSNPRDGLSLCRLSQLLST